MKAKSKKISKKIIKNNKNTKAVKENSITRITKNFLHEILGLQRSLPVIMLFLIDEIESKNKEMAKIKKYLNNNKKEDYKHAGILEKYIDDQYKFIDLHVSAKAIPQSLFVCMVNYFDGFLGKLIVEILKQKPEILKGCSSGLTNSEILGLKKTNKEELIRIIINKEGRSASSNGNILNKIEWIEKKLNLNIFADNDIFLKRLHEIIYRRNSFVHESGKISKEYIESCKKLKLQLHSSIKEDEFFKVSPEYFKDSSLMILQIALMLSNKMMRKILKDSEDADKLIVDASFELLKNKNYFFAKEITSYLLDDKRTTLKDGNRLCLLINKALALKFMKKKKDAEKLISKEDWSVKSNEYKLASLIIQSKYEEASELLKLFSKNEIKNYITWPLFLEFKKSKFFIKAYKKIFGKNYDTDILRLELKKKCNIKK